MATWIIGAIVLILGALAVGYIFRVKQTGGCVGCPDAKNCHYATSASGCAGCAGHKAQAVPEKANK